MHTKVMEGIVGARTNMDMVDVPMRVYKEARRKGDTATMERAMGYVNEFEDKAREYKAEADEGMKEGARELIVPKSDTDLNCSDAPKSHSDSAQEPVIYTKTGEASRIEQTASISVSV